MNAMNGITEHVRRFTSPDGLDIIKPMPQMNANITALLAFAHTMRDAGLDLGPRIEKIEQIWDAAQGALDFSIAQRVAAIDIDTVDPADVTGIVSQAAINYTAHLQTSLFDVHQDSGVSIVLSEFNRALSKAAAELLRTNADDLVKTLRKDFDKAAAAIVAADGLGISKNTQRDELLLNGTDKQITAYRAIPAATAKLDRIANVRLDMARHLTYQANLPTPPHDVACFITGTRDEMELDSAEVAWEGDIEHVQVDGFMNGSSIYKTRTARLGGAWLELVNKGHALHLNTAAEAGAVALAEQVKA